MQTASSWTAINLSVSYHGNLICTCILFSGVRLKGSARLTPTRSALCRPLVVLSCCECCAASMAASIGHLKIDVLYICLNTSSSHSYTIHICCIRASLGVVLTRRICVASVSCRWRFKYERVDANALNIGQTCRMRCSRTGTDLQLSEGRTCPSGYRSLGTCTKGCTTVKMSSMCVICILFTEAPHDTALWGCPCCCYSPNA